MGYPAKLLTEGEQIEFEMRPHWRSMIWPSIVLLATVAGASFLLSATPDGSLQTSLRWERRPSRSASPSAPSWSVSARRARW